MTLSTAKQSTQTNTFPMPTPPHVPKEQIRTLPFQSGSTSTSDSRPSSNKKNVRLALKPAPPDLKEQMQMLHSGLSVLDTKPSNEKNISLALKLAPPDPKEQLQILLPGLSISDSNHPSTKKNLLRPFGGTSYCNESRICEEIIVTSLEFVKLYISYSSCYYYQE